MQAIAIQKSISEFTPENRLEAAAVTLLFLFGATTAVVVLYLVKSALGINLMPGPSPLHNWLYPLVRGY